MQIWFRRHRVVSAVLFAAVALVGTAGVLLYYVDSWLTLPLLVSLFTPLSPFGTIISARDQPPVAALGRSVDAKPDPLQHPGPGGPLRRLGAASAVRQGDSRLLRQGALTSAN